MTSNTRHLLIGTVMTAAQQNTLCTAYCNKKSINITSSYSPGVATDQLLWLWATCSRLTQMPECTAQLHDLGVNNEDAKNTPTKDRLSKLRSLLDDLAEKFMKFYTPFQSIALDESLLLYKGRLLFRQYLPAKRSRFGIKIYSVCDQNGYVFRFRVYTGATDTPNDIESQLPDNAKSNLTKTDQLVIYMMLPILNKGYSLYVDNSYSCLQTV